MSSEPAGKRERDLLRRLEEKRGYLLPHHRLLARHAPDILEAYDAFYSQVWFERNVLDARTKELIAIGIHAAVLEREGLEIHMRRAVAAGATEAEIVEAMALAAIPAGAYATVVAADVWEKLKASDRFSWEDTTSPEPG